MSGSGAVSSSVDAEAEPASVVSRGLASSSVTDAASEELRSELHSMRLTALQRRAADSGVSDAALDDALDSDDPKASLITAIVDQEVDSASAVSGSGAVSSSSADAEAEPASVVSRGLASSSVTDAASEELRSELHSMLSLIHI